jgi:hypothetical protein
VKDIAGKTKTTGALEHGLHQKRKTKNDKQPEKGQLVVFKLNRGYYNTKA